MKPNIPPLDRSVTKAEAETWIAQVVRSIGPGFHFDTSPEDYRTSSGDPLLDPRSCRHVEAGLELTRKILGQTLFEELCLEAVWVELGVRFDRRLNCLVRHAV